MTRFKRWLIDRFLPEYCREEMEQENYKLQYKLTEAEEKNRRLQAYIDGIHIALRAGRKIIIKNGGGAGGDLERGTKQQ